MTKIFKVELYIVDRDERIYDTEGVDHVADVIDDMFESRTVVSNVEESRDFEWDDDLPINLVEAPLEAFEEYFKKD
ncbi:hypothetical protein 015DV004_48 [Bacillus phage 015DV004]|nr:hypothetical protein 015DV004_48 [Bacillus phage 015DV004]